MMTTSFRSKYLGPLYYENNPVANQRLEQAFDAGFRIVLRFFGMSALWVVAVLLLVVVIEHQARAQDSTPAFQTNGINSTLYVGRIGYPTIQSAVSKACNTTGGLRVVIQVGMLPTDSPGTVNGCSAVAISDERTIPTTQYVWSTASASYGLAPSVNVAAAASGITGQLVPPTAYLNVPRPPLSAWEQCLHNAHDQVCAINVDGDSRSKVDDTHARVGTSGAISLDIPYGQRWGDLLRKHLQAVYGSAGTGLLPIKYGDGVQVVDPDYFSVSGSWAPLATLGPYQVEGSANTATDAGLVQFQSGAVLTFAVKDIAWDHLHVACMTTASSGSIAVAIDGKAAGTVCGTPTSSATAVHAVSAETNLGLHVATLTFSGVGYVYAVEGRAGSSGVAVNMLGVGSASLEWFSANPSTNFAFTDLWPHALTIVHHLTNEPGHGIPTSRFLTSLQSIYTHETAQGASVLFLSPTQDGITGQAPYFPILKSYAQSVSAAFLDFRDRYGAAIPPGIFGPDTFHENKKGNAEEAAMIEATILDAALPPPAAIDCSLQGPGYVLVGISARNQPVCKAPPTAASRKCGENFQSYVPLTLSHTLVQETLTNFPAMLSFNGDATNSITLASLKTPGNGGLVQANNAADVIFCSATQGGTQLAHELVSGSYNGSTGAGEWFVQVPQLNSVTDTVIYMFIGNPAAVDSSRPADVWASYAAVYHFGSSYYSDSSPNGNTLTGLSGGGEAGANLKFGGYSVLSSTASIANLAPRGLPVNNDARTIEAWYALPSGAPNPGFLFGYGDYNRESNFSVLANPSTLAAGTNTVSPTVTLPADTAWHFIAWSLAQGAQTAAAVTATLDGNAQAVNCSGTVGCGVDYKTEAGPIRLNGYLPVAGGSFQLAATEWLDEVRISAVARSAGWLGTEFATMTNPAAFVTLGSTTTNTATGLGFFPLGLTLPSLKSTTGTRFLCIGTDNKVVSQSTACSGT